MERLILEILAYHKENLLTDQRVNDIVLVAIELSWDTIRAHKKVLHTVMEMIMRDGIEAGEFDQVDPRETSRADHAVGGALHPSAHDRLSAWKRRQDLEAEVRKFVRFQLRALAPR